VTVTQLLSERGEEDGKVFGFLAKVNAEEDDEVAKYAVVANLTVAVV